MEIRQTRFWKSAPKPTDGKTPRHDKTNRRRFVVPFHQPIRRHRRRDKSQQPE
jgi:hypothetical protein